MNIRFILIGFMLFPLIHACSSGGSSTSTGSFLDSAVSGVTYSSYTHSGETDTNGKFYYKDGETITFKIGDIVIGSALVSSTMTPLSFVSESDSSREKHINILRLLQTLDSDGDSSNGININEGVGVGITNIDFDQSATDFSSDSAVTGFVATNANVSLVSANVAVSHFNSTLTGLDASTIMDFSGSTWIEEVRYKNTNTGCTSDWVTQATYSGFTSVGVTVATINESWNTSCVFNGDSTIVTSDYTYAGLGADSWAFCGTSCTYSNLNKTTYNSIDSDGRTVDTFTSYVPGSSKIITYKKIISSSNSSENGTIFESRIIKQ